MLLAKDLHINWTVCTTVGAAKDRELFEEQDQDQQVFFCLSVHLCVAIESGWNEKINSHTNRDSDSLKFKIFLKPPKIINEMNLKIFKASNLRQLKTTQVFKLYVDTGLISIWP